MFLRFTYFELLWLLIDVAWAGVFAKNCAFQFNEDGHGIYGMSLEGSLIRNHTAAVPVNCFLKCAQDCDCILFNYLPSRRTCELNNASVETMPGQLKSKSDSIYYGLQRVEFPGLASEV